MGITVHAVASAHLLGLSAEEICQQNPDLDPSLFNAALAYSFANRAQIEADLDRDRIEGECLEEKYPAGITASTLGDNPAPKSLETPAARPTPRG